MEFWFSNYLTFYRKSLFLALFATATILIANSCEKNNEFGLEMNPNSNTLEAVYSDTFDLNTFSVYADSIKTDELNGPSLLGNYIDPVFGEVNASIFTQIRLEQAYDFIPQDGTIDDVVIDSAVLYLAIDGYYGDINEQEFNVEILDEDFYKDSS